MFATLQATLASARRAAASALFPSPCAGCGASLAATSRDVFCASCRGEIDQSAFLDPCPRCALPRPPYHNDPGRCRWCRAHPPGFDAALAAGPYRGPLRAACLCLKKPKQGWLAERMAAELLAKRGDELRAAGCDLIVPIPLHWRKLWDRGFNQAERLASCLGRGLGLRVVPALRRAEKTPGLAGLSRAERAEVLASAFAARGRGVAAILGRTVLLVDDILTTGATASSASRTLKAAGARRVVVAVVARTPEPPR